MDAKTEAEHRRNIADLFDKIAEHRAAIGDSAEGALSLAREDRARADKLDPPQRVWQDGELVRDRHSNLWEYVLGVWHCHHTKRDTEALTRHYGPLTRVLTYDPAKQHIADPAKQEVVVSLGGIDRHALDKWLDNTEHSYAWPSVRIARRTANAAREQLGEVTHNEQKEA